MIKEYLKADIPHKLWPKDGQSTGLSEEFIKKAREMVLKQMEENSKKPPGNRPNVFEKL